METHFFTSDPQSGDGMTAVFTIPHGCSFLPTVVLVQGLTQDSICDAHAPAPISIPFEVTWNTTDVILNYFVTAPNTGTDNLKWSVLSQCN